MKKLKFFFLIFIIFNIIKPSFAIENVAYIDMDFVLKNSKLGKSIVKEITDLDSKNIEKLKSRDQEIKILEDDFKKKQNILSPEALNKEFISLNKKLNEFKKEKDLMIKEIKEIKKKKLNEFYSKINPVLESYMSKNNLDLIIDIKTVVIGKSDYNISQDIINAINSKITK